MSVDLTQWVGIAAFGVAAAACLRADRQHETWWRAIAVVQSVCGIEIALGLRYRLHDMADAILRDEGQYGSRSTTQVDLIAITLVLAGLCLAAVLRLRRRFGAGLAGALSGTAIAVAFFLVETASLHAVDTVLYATAGPVKVIGLVWVAISIVTTASALRGARAAGWRP